MPYGICRNASQKCLRSWLRKCTGKASIEKSMDKQPMTSAIWQRRTLITRQLANDYHRKQASASEMASLVSSLHTQYKSMRFCSSASFKAHMTVGECRRAAEACFAQKDISEPAESAMYLIAHALKKKTLQAIPPNRRVSPEELEVLKKLIGKRLRRIPIQYVIGEWDFLHLTLDIKPPVLIPRPETEELVNHILSYETLLPGSCFMEVGPGSGAICCAILSEHPQVTCVAVDKSPDACELTEHNAKKFGVNERLSIHNMPIDEFNDWSVKFDFIVSNPPYIKSKDMSHLAEEISRYEDRSALHGGEDGLDVIRNILQLAPHVLRSEGSLWLEVDSSHPQMIEGYLANQRCLRYFATIKDFNELPRFCHIKMDR